MTMTFIIIYVVIALIFVGLINLFMAKSKKKRSKRQMEQMKQEDNASDENYQSKFNISDKEGSNESTMESETATTEENLEDDDTLSSEVTDQSIDNSDETTDADHQNINPNSEEAKVNEKLKEKHSSFMFGKGTSQGKVLLAMIFGMFIAILNQTLLNVALPKINTDFNISANTGQWLMTGFMLVNGILIQISD